MFMPYDCLMHLNNCARRGNNPCTCHWIMMCLSLIGLNNTFYDLFRCWCGRATLILLSVVMLSKCSIKVLPKCTCLREQPAPQPSTPLARSHLCSTDRQVQTIFCIPSIFRVNFFYPRKYHLQIPFVNATTWNATLYIFTASLQKHTGKHQHVLSVYSGGDLSTAFPFCRSSFEVECSPQATFISHMQGEKFLPIFHWYVRSLLTTDAN